MKTKIVLFLIVTLCAFNGLKAQTNINNYKYVVVPTAFNFLDQPDKYRLNTLTKLIFEKHGFTVFMEDEKLPNDAISNNCLVLKANVLKESGVFNSKLKIQLKNCKSEIIFTSRVGSSKEKSYQVAYTLALREASKSFDSFTYEYQESEAISSYTKNNNQDSRTEIEQLKQEIKTLKKEQELVAEKKMQVDAQKEVEVKNLDLLYAKTHTNGFNLLDNASKIIYTINKTGMFNVYLVEGKNAIIYKLDANWLLEYYENEKLKTKILNIKF